MTDVSLKSIGDLSKKKTNFLLYVVVIVDPLYKLSYIEYLFEKVYEENMVNALMENMKEKLTILYEWYVKNDSNTSTQPPLDDMDEVMVDDMDKEASRANFDLDFKRRLEQQSSKVSKNELEKYLVDGYEIDSPNFDLFGWWRTNSTKYLIVAQIAKDVRAIPVLTIASESAFSMGGRVLDLFRSSLAPNTVEALICTQNWW